MGIIICECASETIISLLLRRLTIQTAVAFQECPWHPFAQSRKLKLVFVMAKMVVWGGVL